MSSDSEKDLVYVVPSESVEAVNELLIRIYGSPDGETVGLRPSEMDLLKKVLVINKRTGKTWYYA